MKQSPITKQNALETWMTDEIATLASTLPTTKARLLILDAEMTDLETRCRLGKNGNTNGKHHPGQPKKTGAHPRPRAGAKPKRVNQTTI